MALKAWLLSRALRWALLAAVVIAGAGDAWQLLREDEWNRRIAAGTVADSDEAPPPEVEFARAFGLAARGDVQAALVAYRGIRPEVSPSLASAARYNSGNLLLAQALAIDSANQQGQRIPLIELAKETYREVLRAEPAHWDARFKFERAQRLLPDPDAGEEPGGDPQPGAERAVTTMRGYAPGLP